uniref:Uncharacterized protein n=1 Tax=Arundo donax TaxID=35708 RepID=A0A0A8Y9R7_ARUDO
MSSSSCARNHTSSRIRRTSLNEKQKYCRALTLKHKKVAEVRDQLKSSYFSIVNVVPNLGHLNCKYLNNPSAYT